MEEVPFQDRSVPKVEVDWDRSLWWWYPISRAIHPALRISSLLWSLIAVALLRLGFETADTLFGSNIKSSKILTWLSEPSLLFSNFQTFSIPSLSIENLALITFSLVWLALIGSTLGGVLARRAAVELGQRTVAPWGRSIKLVFSRILSYLWVVGMHFVAIGGLLLPFITLGWFTRFGSIVAVVAGVLLLLLSLPLMFGIGRLIVSLTVGYPLSVCAISIEKRADAFEGFSRSNAYFFQRPVLAVLIFALLLLVGEVGAGLLTWMVSTGWGLIEQAYLSASSDTDLSVDRFLKAGGWLAANFLLAYRFSYFWAASAGLYLILRRCVDNTDLDEMEVFESELEQNPPKIPTTSQPAEVKPTSNPAEVAAESTTEPSPSED